MSNVIVIPAGSGDLELRLEVGGELLYKWDLFEHVADDVKKLASGEGTKQVPIGKVGNTKRSFQWTVAAVNMDGGEPTVRVKAEARSGAKSIANITGDWTAKGKAPKARFHVTLRSGT